MSKLELVFTSNDGRFIKSLIDSSENDTVADIADNIQEALDNYADMIANYDMGDGDCMTLMYEPTEEEREEYKIISF